MNRQKNVSTFIGFDNEFENSSLVLFGAPFDGTTSFRPGTRFAPEIIRKESYGLESYSPYLEMDLDEFELFDQGDLEFPFGNPKKVIDIIYENTRDILKNDKTPFMIGGEHLVTLGTIKAMAEKYKDLRLIHLDAHTDLREDYLGEKLSHATVIKRVWDIIGDNKIYQFGIRSGTKEEFDWSKEHTTMEKFSCDTFSSIKEELLNFPVYISIDLDVLDPSIFSGTGTIEPGGISFKELISFIEEVSELNIVGADVVELSPHYDQSGMSTAVACKVIRELSLAILK